MKWTCCLLLLLALSLEGLAAVPHARVQRQQSSECQAGLLRIQEDCSGLSLPDVDAEENVAAALEAACTTKLCHEAVSNAMTVCTGQTDLDQLAIQRANDLFLSFYCKKLSSGQLCGELVLKHNLSSLDNGGCTFISPATVPDTCPQQCTTLASLLEQTFGCCWTEYVEYSMALLSPLLPSISPNASELWSRCNVIDPGYCSSTLEMEEVTSTTPTQPTPTQPTPTQPNVDIGKTADSGQIPAMAAMKSLLLVSVLLMTLLML